MTTKTWLDAIEANGFDGRTRQMLVTEAQRTRFPGELPGVFQFLGGGFVDLGFENLGLPEEELDAVRLAFVGTGVMVPRTGYRLRHLRPGYSVVEPVDGSEAVTLPDQWTEAVLVLGHDEKYTWIGKRVPPGWLAEVDLNGYKDAGDGWVSKTGVLCRPDCCVRRSARRRGVRMGPRS
jgi:hypothetical protein